MVDPRQVHIEIENRPAVNVLRDVARAVGFSFRIDQLPNNGAPDLVVEVDLPSRDQLAAMAMQAQIANPGWMNSGTG
jgi:hypothetical protein